MNHSRMHSGHMWLIAGAAVAAALLGYGIGWAISIAILGCGAMFVALLWLINSDRDRPNPTGIDDSARDEVRHSGEA